MKEEKIKVMLFMIIWKLMVHCNVSHVPKHQNIMNQQKGNIVIFLKLASLTMLAHAHRPVSHWVVVFLINRLPSRTLVMSLYIKNCFNVFLIIIVCVSLVLYVFLSYVLLIKIKKIKSKSCVFLGYSLDHQSRVSIFGSQFWSCLCVTACGIRRK